VESEETSVSRLLAAAKLARQTRENYVLRVRAYLRRLGQSPDEFVRKVGEDPKWFEEGFIVFIGEVSKRSAPSTTAFWRDSLRRFLEINRVKGVDWDYVNQFLPKVRKSGLDRAPTIDEIRKLVSFANLRTKCLILFLVSSGARIGSVDYLGWRDFEEVAVDQGKLARVTIYRGEPETYSSFVTPECWESLLRYRRTREQGGESVVPSSPVFVWETNGRRVDGEKVRPVGVRALKNDLATLMNYTGIRSVLTEKGNYKTYEFKQAHGFRKFFKTRMELSGVRPIITEMLMGHALGVSGSYMKPTAGELIAEYRKAIESLTISRGEGIQTTSMDQDSLVRMRYLTAVQLAETNRTVLKEIKVKKADSYRVLSRSALDEIVEKMETEGSDVYEKAAILLVDLTRRHPFASAVRRTAYAAAKLFLEANGEQIHVKYEPKVLQGVRERFYSGDEIVNWLKGNEIRKFVRA
jgi:death-on-curing family protein